MAVSTAYAPLTFSWTTTNQVLPVTWPYFTGSLVVTEISSAGAETVKTLTTHYTVSGGTDADGLPATGSVTMVGAETAGSSLRVERSTTKTQESSWTNGGAFQAKTIESSFDRALLINQENAYLRDLDWRTAWVTATAYYENDLVENDGSSYICIADHTSAAATEPGTGVDWADDWDLVAAKGDTGATGATGAAGTNGTNGSNGTDPGLRWLFDSATAMADPGTGDLRLNNATLSAVTAIAISDATGETGNPSVEALVLSWDDSTTTALRGTLVLKKVSAPQNYAIYSITGGSTDNAGWTQLAVAHVNSNGSFTDTDTLSVQFYRTGNAGAGAGDALVANPLSQFAATSSAQLAGVISDETGSGALVFATSPTLVTPALGTPASGTLTNCTGLPLAGVVDSTTESLGVGSIELGHASDTTIARSGAGDMTIEGNQVYRAGGTDVIVADGGTGLSSTTAYAVLCGGTTSTAALQSIAGVGTSGQVLTSNGAGALPTFQAAGGGMSLLTSGTVSAAATLDIVLTSYTAYKSLLFVLSGFRPATDGDQLLMRFSSDGGVGYDASGYNYAGLYVRDSAATVTGFNAGSASDISLAGPTLDIGSAATEGLNIVVRLCNQTAAAFWSRVTFEGYYISSAATPAGVWVSGGGSRETAQDTDAVRFFFASGNITAGNYAVYGLA